MRRENELNHTEFQLRPRDVSGRHGRQQLCAVRFLTDSLLRVELGLCSGGVGRSWANKQSSLKGETESSTSFAMQYLSF